MKQVPGVRGLERWVLGLSGLSVIVLQAPILGYRAYANVDEAYASAIASRLLDGYQLYQGAISQRGPLMYRLYQGFASLHGWNNVLALRIWALILAFAHIVLVYQLGRRLLSREAAVVACALTCYGLSFGFPPEDGVAINGEVLQLPALLAATLLHAGGMMRRPGSFERAFPLFLGSVLFGIAISIKQSAVVHLVPTFVWMVADLRRNTSKSALIRDLIAACAGTPIVPLLFVVHAAAKGSLWDMYFYTVIYNRDVHMRPAPSFPFAWKTALFVQMIRHPGFCIATALLTGYALSTIARRVDVARRQARPLVALVRGFGPRHYLALHFVLATMIAASMYRFFPHYFMQALPFMALCAGAILDRVVRRSHAAHGVVKGFAAFTLVATGYACYFIEDADGRVAHDETVDSMSRVIAATTPPDARIFVWGFSPWLYGYAGRRPAGRYVFSTYVTGYVPWFSENRAVEDARIVPGSVEALLDDLEREQPAVVVDAGAVMMLRPMRTYERFAEYLHDGFCFDVRIGAMDLYRRKPQGEACRTPFPVVAPGVDYMGRFLPALIPKQVDAATSQRLPEGDYFRPIYFLDAPRPMGIEFATTKRREKDAATARQRGFCVPELGDPQCANH